MSKGDNQEKVRFRSTRNNYYTIFLVSFILYIIYTFLLQNRLNALFLDFKKAGLLEKIDFKDDFINKAFLISILMPFSAFFVLPYTETLYLSIFLLIIALWQKENFTSKNYFILFICHIHCLPE